MKVVVTGSRGFTNKKYVFWILDGINEETPITKLVQGGATGVDALALEWALTRAIPVTTYVAEWRKYGRAAGPKRNAKMLREERPDLVIKFPGGSGTQNCVDLARAARIKVKEIPEPSTDN